MSRNENRQGPLHFAVRMNRAEMIPLLLELGVDPLMTDDSGNPPAVYAMNADIDRPIMEAINGQDDSAGDVTSLMAALATGDLARASRLVSVDHTLLDRGALHLMAKRGDARSVEWLLSQGANPNAKWAHFDAEVTPLHMVAFSGDVRIAQSLLDAGADRTVRDSLHDGDALGWAEHFGRVGLRELYLLGSRPQ